MGGLSVLNEIQEQGSSGRRKPPPGLEPYGLTTVALRTYFPCQKKNNYLFLYDKAEGNQFIMYIPNKEILFNERHNELYYHDQEDRDLVLVNTVEEKKYEFSGIDLKGAR